MDTFEMVNIVKVTEQLCRFLAFVRNVDGNQSFISFRDSTGFLGREEDYKSRIAEDARRELNFNNWDESWIGSGRIAEFAKRAMSRAGNLVNMNQQVDFKNRLDPEHPKYRQDAEHVLYDIYRNPICVESESFTKAIDTFGAKYDTIAFLFFIKDDTRFLPISTGHFDKGFDLLGIDYSTSYKCSWENYQGFIDVLKDIRDLMEIVLPMEGTPRLIDAHSFLWIIQDERFITWMPDMEQSIQIERDVEECVQNAVNEPVKRRRVATTAFTRSVEVVKETRRRAKGICQYCRKPAPFLDGKGNPYLEVHHVIWLSRGGEDSTDNTVALCPNCHTRMHILDSPEDIEMLRQVAGRNS